MSYVGEMIENLTGFIFIAGAGVLAIGVLVLQIVVPIGVIVWLVWEWAPFGNKFDQRLFYTKKISVASGDIKKVYIMDYAVDIDNQRVIQKIVSPLKPIKKRRREDSLWKMTSAYFYPEKEKFTRQESIKCFIKAPTIESRKKCDQYAREREAYEQTEFFRAFVELEDVMPQEQETLVQLENCVVKSSDDWNCNSTWFGAGDNQSPSIGKLDGSWVSEPYINPDALYEWKASMAIEWFRCGSACLLQTKKELEERQKQFELFFNEMEKRRENR